MGRLRVTVLVHNLSGNNVVRMYPIAKVLERFCKTEVVGFVGPGGVFRPYRDEFEYKTVSLAKFPSVARRIGELRKLITGDVIYAFKPNVLSLGVGLLDRHSSRRPVVVDIEDFDPAFQYTRGWRAAAKNSLMLWDPFSLPYLLFGDYLSRFANERTVGSTFLQKKHGGILLPHGADTSAFDPALFDPPTIKKKWGVGGSFAILFAGKVSEHKGVDTILKVVLETNGQNQVSQMKLVVVGGSESDNNIMRLKAQGGDSFLHIPAQPHHLMPEMLSLADLIVLPQVSSTYTEAQIPAKVYEGMAMGKPIIASRVSDLPKILEGCGIIFDPSDHASLGDAVRKIYSDPSLAASLGMKARGRCEERYSWNAMERLLRNVFSQIPERMSLL